MITQEQSLEAAEKLWHLTTDPAVPGFIAEPLLDQLQRLCPSDDRNADFSSQALAAALFESAGCRGGEDVEQAHTNKVVLATALTTLLRSPWSRALPEKIKAGLLRSLADVYNDLTSPYQAILDTYEEGSFEHHVGLITAAAEVKHG